MSTGSDKAMTAPTFYHRLRDSQRLLLTRDEVRWQMQVTDSPPPAEVVIDFGCGLQLTPNLMIEFVDVLTALGVSMTAVAGPQWCCGMPVEEDQPGGGTGVVRASVRHLSKFRPHTVIQSCGAWWPQTARLRDAGESVPFELEHLSQFVLEALERRADSITWAQGPTSRVLVHLKAQDATPEERAERAASLGATDRSIPAILALIPSVEVVGEVEIPGPGSPCEADDDDNSVLDAVSPEEREGVRAGLAEQGVRTGADTIVCAHHRCAQEWGKFASEGMAVRHYISVLAQAMGLARPNRFHACWALPSIEDIVEETGPAWRSWELSRDEATNLAAALFPRHPRSRD